MDGWMEEGREIWMDGWMVGWLQVGMEEVGRDGWMDGGREVNVSIFGRMYIHV